MAPNKQATEVLFSCKNKPDLFFNGTPVHGVSEHKNLDLTLQPTLRPRLINCSFIVQRAHGFENILNYRIDLNYWLQKLKINVCCILQCSFAYNGDREKPFVDLL